MMLPTVYTWLKTTAVQAIIGTPPRAYRHGDAPQDTTKPYVTWVMVSGVPDNELSAVAKSDRYTIQFDCWHQTDAGVESLATAVRNAVEPYGHMTNMPINNRDAETKLYRIALQFDILQNR
jgi:hypothetical protein